MLSAEDYLRSAEIQLLRSGGVPVAEGEIAFESGDLNGFLDIDLTYPSQHRLAVFLAVDVSYGYPLWTKYSFHFQDGKGACVFRYDNVPHHPELATFPDHKHVGPPATAQEHPRPALRRIVEEVLHAVELRLGPA